MESWLQTVAAVHLVEEEEELQDWDLAADWVVAASAVAMASTLVVEAGPVQHSDVAMAEQQQWLPEEVAAAAYQDL